MSARRDLRAAREEITALRADRAELARAVAARDEHIDILSRQFTEASARIIRQETELCDLGRQLAATQRQLDAALGMDHPDIARGAHWQSHREDLPTVPQPVTPAPRAPLPRRTSAETAAWRMIRDDIPLDAFDARPNTGTEAA
ncbi:hypothetical protein ACWD33_26345 [Streptomyces xiamenensis]